MTIIEKYLPYALKYRPIALKYLPDALVLIGIYILAHNSLVVTKCWDSIVVGLGGCETHTDGGLVTGVMVVAIGADLFIRRYFLNRM